jgi:hypothetical protein
MIMLFFNIEWPKMLGPKEHLQINFLAMNLISSCEFGPRQVLIQM